AAVGPGADGDVFFDTYFSTTRFGVESVLAVVSSVTNAAALVAIANAPRSRHTVYHTLFVNLAIVNIIACQLSWFCNNSLFLFQRHLADMLRRGATLCWMFVVLVAAVFASSLFGLISTLTMLGLTTVQYIAICRPLDQVALVSQTRVYRFIAFAWLVSLFTCLAPFLTLLVIVHRSACTFTTLRHIQLIVVGGVNTFVALVFAIHVVMLAQCVKIYIEISLLRKRLSQFRFREDIRGEWKAFITTAVLLLTMVAFFLPYSVVYVVSINHISQASLQSGALIYYMNLLPYLKFLSDPIIYGMRTLEVREGCFRLLAR
ncbi:hypothetical protein LSAT2_010959, partial [Lamellibrachia satsuma]